MEAVPYGWYDGGDDLRFVWGGGRGTSIGETSERKGTGKANAYIIVSRLGSVTYAQGYVQCIQ